MTVSDDTFIHDLYYGNRWEQMLAHAAPGEELELAEVHQIVCAGAAPSDVKRLGESWLASFLSYCERGGIGSLCAHSDGTYTLVLAQPLPTPAEAWARVGGTWPELDAGPSD